MNVDRYAFEWLNDGPEWRWLRVPQQLGTPWALVGTAGLLASTGRQRDAIAALVALPVLKGTEVVIKETLKRPRPVYRVPTALRDDAPVEGGSMPSGHAALAAAAAYFLSSLTPTWLSPALWGATGIACTVRVHQGAHWPSDTVVGATLGAAVAATATAVAHRLPPAAQERWLHT